MLSFSNHQCFWLACGRKHPLWLRIIIHRRRKLVNFEGAIHTLVSSPDYTLLATTPISITWAGWPLYSRIHWIVQLDVRKCRKKGKPGEDRSVGISCTYYKQGLKYWGGASAPKPYGFRPLCNIANWLWFSRITFAPHAYSYSKSKRRDV